MRAVLLASLLSLLATVGIAEQEGRQSEAKLEWLAAKEAGEEALARFFKEGGEQFVNEPTFVVKHAQFLWEEAAKSTTPEGAPIQAGIYTLSTKTSPNGGFRMTPRQPSLDPDLVAQAVAVLKDGQDKFPNRLDLAFLVASFHSKSGNHDDAYQTYADLCRTVKEAPGMRYFARVADQTYEEWYEVEEVAPSESIADAVHGLCIHHWNRNTAKDRDYMKRLAELATEEFPKQPQGWNMLGAYYSSNEDYERAREVLERGHQANPDYAVVMRNLAWIAEKQNEPGKAKKYYQMIIDRTDSEADREKAEASLKRLSEE